MSYDVAVTKNTNQGQVLGSQNAGTTNSIYDNGRATASSGQAYSTPDAGTEELQQNERVSEEYIQAALNNILKGKDYKIVTISGEKKLDLDIIKKLLKINNTSNLNMTKNEFDELLECFKAAINECVSDTGEIDPYKLMQTYNGIVTFAIKTETDENKQDCSIQDRIEDAINGINLYKDKEI